MPRSTQFKPEAVIGLSWFKFLLQSLSIKGSCLHKHCIYIVSDHRTQNEYFGEEFKTELSEFCPWIGGDLQVFDANGDGYDDLTCHTSTGIIQITESHLVDNRKFHFPT